jgi:hypothetical protein
MKTALHALFFLFVLGLPFTVPARVAGTSLAPVEVGEGTFTTPQGKEGFPRGAEIHYPIFKGEDESTRTLQRLVLASYCDFLNDEDEGERRTFTGTVEELRQTVSKNAILTQATFEVGLNDGRFLGLTFTSETLGAYPWTTVRRIVIDRETVAVLPPAAVFTNTDGLCRLLDRKLQAEIASSIKGADVKPGDSLYDEYRFEEPDVRRQFREKNLPGFIIGTKGVTFFYDYAFPHVGKASEPSGKFFLSWKEMKPFISPDGPFGKFVKE